jgi:hypothetical protein
MNTDKPTLRIAAALEDLLQCNERTRGRGVGEMYLGEDVFIVRLTRPRVVNGQSWPLDQVMSIEELWNLEDPETRP